MFKHQKYIRIKEFDGMSDVIIQFPSILDHRQFTYSLGLKEDDIVSAGFFSLSTSREGPIYKCYGKSISLGKESDPKKDSYELNRQIYDARELERIK